MLMLLWPLGSPQLRQHSMRVIACREPYASCTFSGSRDAQVVLRRVFELGLLCRATGGEQPGQSRADAITMHQ